MIRKSRLLACAAGAVAACVFSAQASAAPLEQQMHRGGITTMGAGSIGSFGITQLEIRPFTAEADAGTIGSARSVPLVRNPRSVRPLTAAKPLSGSTVGVTGAVGLDRSWQGLNLFQERFANNGNQFTVDPPDQGLCAGNGFVLETVNTVMRVFHEDGRPATQPIDLNTFFGYRAAINRQTGVFGPSLGDPSCYFDPQTQRWFNLVWTFDSLPDGTLTGKQHFDLAVSRTANPLGRWRVYRLPTQNDGTQGTPNHHCSGGVCESDYPHIGGDRNGIYITDNEYGAGDFEFHGAQLYAISKRQLVGWASHPRVLLYQNLHVGGQLGFTVWPTTGDFSDAAGGTEFFLSSNAAGEVGSGSSSQIATWALTHTRRLSLLHAAPRLQAQFVRVPRYVQPPAAEQKPGPTPLRSCLNDRSMATPFGQGCWQYFSGSIVPPGQPPAHFQRLAHLDTNDSRMQQTVLNNGLVWGALDTGVWAGGHSVPGVAYYAVAPVIRDGRLDAHLVHTGTFAVAGESISYPAIAMLHNGKGAIAVTLGGHGYYPSAAYALVQGGQVGAVHVASPGVGPSDSFSDYPAFGPPFTPRWGDYGAAIPAGDRVWIASEYIGQRCSLTRFLVDTARSPFGTCEMTRAPLGNWSTRISLVTP